MSAVTTTTARVALRRLRTAALVAALACAANVAYASFASVVITGFTVTSNADPAFFFFAPTDTRSQAWILSAEDGGGIANNVDGVPDWSNQTESAVRPNAQASVASSVYTDPLTALETPLFTLSANATPTSGNFINIAFGNMVTSGIFCFGDGANFDGTTAGCNAAGSLTFTLFYDLIATAAPGGLGSNAYAELDVLGTGVPGGFFFDFAFADEGDESKLGQSFTWTANLATGGLASVDIAGTVVVQAVPEPGVLGLLALGLIGLAATRRRKDVVRPAA